MALVDHDVIPVVRAKSLEQTPRVEALDRCEKMVVAERPAATDEELAEGLVAEHVAEGVARLAEQFLAVREEEQPRPQARRADLAMVIERRDDGLPRAGRRHHEVATPIVQRALGLEVLEDFLLEGVRP